MNPSDAYMQWRQSGAQAPQSAGMSADQIANRRAIAQSMASQRMQQYAPMRAALGPTLQQRAMSLFMMAMNPDAARARQAPAMGNDGRPYGEGMA